jgi:hypothetical protein
MKSYCVKQGEDEVIGFFFAEDLKSLFWQVEQVTNPSNVQYAELFDGGLAFVKPVKLDAITKDSFEATVECWWSGMKALSFKPLPADDVVVNWQKLGLVKTKLGDVVIKGRG